MTTKAYLYSAFRKLAVERISIIYIRTISKNVRCRSGCVCEGSIWHSRYWSILSSPEVMSYSVIYFIK